MPTPNKYCNLGITKRVDDFIIVLMWIAQLTSTVPSGCVLGNSFLDQSYYLILANAVQPPVRLLRDVFMPRIPDNHLQPSRDEARYRCAELCPCSALMFRDIKSTHAFRIFFKVLPQIFNIFLQPGAALRVLVS